jgi:hypothetical protein
MFCFCNGALLKGLYKMAASLKGKRTPITTPPYQVPSVDITPDPPIFSLVTTFKKINIADYTNDCRAVNKPLLTQKMKQKCLDSQKV